MSEGKIQKNFLLSYHIMPQTTTGMFPRDCWWVAKNLRSCLQLLKQNLNQTVKNKLARAAEVE